MLYVALAAIAALVVVTVALAGLLRSQARAHARREDLLVNQVCRLADKPWQPAPADERIWRNASATNPPVLVGSPEQWAEDEL